MKKQILTIALFFFLANMLFAQPWNSSLPADKVKNHKVTLFDYQKAFNDYWEPLHVVDGYYFKDGIKIKAGGWKQFKRWEWYWETRVDPTTGAFPSTSVWEEQQKGKIVKNNSKSVSGQWVSLGPSSSSGGYAGLGRLNCVGFNTADNSIIYAGAPDGGIWKTTDGGSNWIPLADDIVSIGVSSIVVVPTSGDDIIYIATGDKDHSDSYTVGVLKSTDGGSTWQTTGLSYDVGQQDLIFKLLMDPGNSNTLYAATTTGLYKTTDAGDNWNLISNNTYGDLEFKPGDATVIYAGNKNGDVHISTDSGSTWSTALPTSGKRVEIAVSANDPNIVYALVAAPNSELYGIYKSTNSGNSYSVVYNGINLLGWDCSGGDSGGQAWYDLAFAADPNDADIIFLGGVNNWKSSDGGITWNINNHWSSTCGGGAVNVHADKHYLAFQNGTSTLFECNDGGLYNTSDGGSTWNHLTNGMIISQMYKLGVAQTTTTDVIAGLQDNGTKAMLNSTWNDVIGGDGMECLIDYTDENTQYGSLYYGDIHRTTDHWASSTGITSGITGDAAWVTPFVQDPNNSNTIFVGFQDVWKSTNQGNTWTQLSNWSGNTLKSLAVAPSNSDYIYAATSYTLYRTTDGGASWNDITGSIPIGASNITYVSVKDTDPNTIWVSLGQFNNYGVFESTDGGATWNDISNGLPTLPTNCVIQNKQNTTQVELYAATDVGVYLKLGGADWIPFYYNMPNVIVTELDIYYDDNNPLNSLLRASTFGRGLWESDLYTASNTLAANFYANTTTVELGEYVLFTDNSTGTPTSWQWTFAGGTPDNYTGQTPPPIQYNSEGNWDVELIVSDGTDFDTLIQADYITVTDCNITTFPYFEDFENSGEIPTCWSQQFISGNNVPWQFITGNGGSNPTTAHSGTYNACLIDQDSDEDKTILSTPPLNLASFTSAKVTFWHTQEFWSPDQDELAIYYKVASDSAWTLLQTYTTDIANWSQDSVNLENLSSTYYIGFEGNARYGYGVCLDDVEVSGTTESIIANFEGSPTEGNFPLDVSFTDLSTGTIDTWDWDFGDGNISTEQNPMHTYTTAGTFTVSLTVSGSAGSNTKTITDYITTTYITPTADFEGTPTSGLTPLIVNFTDMSIDSVNAWQWDFGDGNTSTEQNPSNTYTTAGSYNVSLIVSGPGGNDTLEKENYIITSVPPPIADFVGNPTTGEAPLLVNFTDLSTGNTNTWQWIFGDGNTSTEQNPTNEYIEPGNYTVSLTTTGDGGTSTQTKVDYILIPVGFGENKANSISVFPNPTTNSIRVVFPEAGIRFLTLKNIEGKQLLKIKSLNKNITINLTDLKPGTYTLTVEKDNDITNIVKVVKK